MTVSDWKQEMAWTEDEARRKLRMRRQVLALSVSERGAEFVARQPIFCFETACKMLLWADYVYEVEEQPLSRPLDQLMRLLQLQETELLWDRDSDIKVCGGGEQGVLSLLVSHHGGGARAGGRVGSRFVSWCVWGGRTGYVPWCVWGGTGYVPW